MVFEINKGNTHTNTNKNTFFFLSDSTNWLSCFRLTTTYHFVKS